jgi:hypothetical protein
MDKIFEPFFTTKEPGKGTGLGLATVLGILRGHNGFFEIDSEPGRGTVFKIYLPATPGVKDEETKKTLQPGKSGKGEMLLVVDDETMFRDVLRRILRNAGYEVLATADGIEAIAEFARHHGEIKAVISDLSMPGLDGLGLARILKKVDPAVKIIISSGVVDDPQQIGKINELKTLGVKNFLAKPYDSTDILSALHTALMEN